MYCPEHLIVKNKFMIICFYDCADIRWKYIPWKRKYNPLRYELSFFRKYPKTRIIINPEGIWARRVSDAIYRAKRAIWF